MLELEVATEVAEIDTTIDQMTDMVVIEKTMVKIVRKVKLIFVKFFGDLDHLGARSCKTEQEK